MCHLSHEDKKISSTNAEGSTNNPVTGICKKSITVKTGTNELNISEDDESFKLIIEGFGIQKRILHIHPSQFLRSLYVGLFDKQEIFYGSTILGKDANCV